MQLNLSSRKTQGLGGGRRSGGEGGTLSGVSNGQSEASGVMGQTPKGAGGLNWGSSGGRSFSRRGGIDRGNGRPSNSVSTVYGSGVENGGLASKFFEFFYI